VRLTASPPGCAIQMSNPFASFAAWYASVLPSGDHDAWSSTSDPDVICTGFANCRTGNRPVLMAIHRVLMTTAAASQ
jgi:hypothetical protein